ncbi:FtsX-like permease family protein [Streptomyces sp. SID13031]|uniref:FtsX-like permease family protein n=1 Tax=Streptomyces sp. SID13031 TaxID=2706046 RepID=UPI001941E24D|nr:FtsX-like permease family protein [Streptomyces sp. SID13031]
MTDLGLRFVRRPGPGGRAANLAALGATAIVALLLTFLIAGSLGLTHRSDRIGWRNTDDGDAKSAVGVVNQIDDMAGGVPLTRYDVAINNPQKDAELPPPPGLAKSPKPGEVFVSPEVAKHWSEDLSKRYKIAKPTGIITDKGLSSTSDRVIIQGVEKNSPGVAAADHPKYLDTWNGKSLDERMATLLVLVAFGITLVLFPLLSLVGQAAGVAAKRREHRLAALRLAGATRSQVLWLSAVEQAVLAFLGAIVGVIGYTVLTPLIARIPLGGGRWYVHDLTPSWWVVLIVLIAVPVLSVISALIGLGRVSITPLGVVRGQTRKGTSALRLGLLVIGPIMLAILGTGGAILPLLIGIGLAALAVRIVGPFAVQVIGKFMARTAKGPVALLAGRRLADDPKAAFRPVAALVLSGFVTGFLALFMPYGMNGDGKDASFEFYTKQGQAVVVAEDAKKKLSEAGVKGQVTSGDGVVDISVSTGDREKVRTVLYDLVPGKVPLTDAEKDDQDAGMYKDLRLGVALLLGLVFVTGAASTAAGAVGTALDQAGPARALRRSGVPLKVIERSARLAAVVPVVGVGLPVVGFGALTGLALSGGEVLTQGSSGVVLLVAQVVIGLVLVAVAGAAGAPVLRKASVG